MKKLLVLLAVLILCAQSVFAAPSQSSEPVLGNFEIKNNDGGKIKMSGLGKAVQVTSGAEGDNLNDINDMIAGQNKAVSNGSRKVIDEVIQQLKLRGLQLPDGMLVAGKGFYDLKLEDENGKEVHNGLEFEVKLPQITNNTDKVMLVHYSNAKGLELVEAKSFDAAKQTAKFELADTSNVMFLIHNKASQSYSQTKTGVDGVGDVSLKALAIAALGVGIITVIASKKK